eukprot:g1988.t1
MGCGASVNYPEKAYEKFKNDAEESPELREAMFVVGFAHEVTESNENAKISMEVWCELCKQLQKECEDFWSHEDEAKLIQRITEMCIKVGHEDMSWCKKVRLFCRLKEEGQGKFFFAKVESKKEDGVLTYPGKPDEEADGVSPAGWINYRCGAEDGSTAKLQIDILEWESGVWNQKTVEAPELAATELKAWEAVVKALDELKPLKVVANDDRLATLLRDGQVKLFEQLRTPSAPEACPSLRARLLAETTVTHLTQPKELLSFQLVNGEPLIAVRSGQIFFYRHTVGEWFFLSGEAQATEADVLAAQSLDEALLAPSVASYAQRTDADVRRLRELCSRYPQLRPTLLAAMAPPNPAKQRRSSALNDLRDELATMRRCSLSGSSRGRCVVAWAPCRRRSAAASDVCTSTTSCGRGASLIVDLLNHSPWGVCAPPFFDQQRRELVVKLLGQAAVGQEVCLSYGPLQTWEMLFYYGFCPVENPHDRMVVKVDLPEDEATSEREVILRLQGIPTEVALRPPVEVGCGWCSLGALCPQLLRCFRVLLGDIETLDLDAAPGEGTSDLDLQCLTAIEELLQGLLQPLREGPEEAERSWWHLYGARIEAFRQSQRTLLEGNLQQLNALRRRLQGENKKPRMEDALAAQKKRCPAAGDAGIAAFNSEHQGNLIALRRAKPQAERPTLRPPGLSRAATEFVAARWAQVEARLPLAARNLFRGRTQGVAPLPVSEELSTMVRPTVRWVPKMPTQQQVPLGIGRLGRAPQLPTANAGATVHAAMRAPFVRAFRALERAQRVGKYRYSTVRPMGRSIFPKRQELPQRLYPSPGF